MRKNLWLSALTLCAVMTAGAQSLRVTADVPFAFHVNKQVVPAGSYEILCEPNSVLWIKSLDGRSIANTMTQGDLRLASPAASKLVFRRYGDQFFLAKVESGATNVSRLLPKTKSEEAIAQNTPRDRVLTASVPAK